MTKLYFLNFWEPNARLFPLGFFPPFKGCDSDLRADDGIWGSGAASGFGPPP